MNARNKSPRQAAAHSHEEIAPLAHFFWEQEGRPEGKAEEHWQRAEAHLLSNRTELKAESEV